jgi:Secretion system C-terminal sorting domain
MKKTAFLVFSLLFSIGIFSQIQSSSSVTISTPTVKAVSGNCQNPTSYIILYNLPAKGTWTIKQFPKDTAIQGTGPNFAFVNVPKGSYRFTVTDSAGVTSDTTKMAIIAPSTTPPSTPVIGDVVQPTKSEPTATVTIKGLPTANEGPWTLYISPGNLNFSGSDSTATIYGLNYGDYSFIVENVNLCRSEPAKVSIIKPVINSLDENTTSNYSINLFPNPTTDQITIERPNNNGKLSKFDIINDLGVAVESGYIENTISLNVSMLSNGIYLLKLDDGTTTKFIKR